MRDFRPRAIWGLSRISARDEARFMRHLRRYVPYGARTIHGVTKRLVGSYAAPRR